MRSDNLTQRFVCSKKCIKHSNHYSFECHLNLFIWTPLSSVQSCLNINNTSQFKSLADEVKNIFDNSRKFSLCWIVELAQEFQKYRVRKRRRYPPILSKWPTNEEVILTLSHNDWTKIVDFPIKAYFSPKCQFSCRCLYIFCKQTRSNTKSK